MLAYIANVVLGASRIDPYQRGYKNSNLALWISSSIKDYLLSLYLYLCEAFFLFLFLQRASAPAKIHSVRAGGASQMFFNVKIAPRFSHSRFSGCSLLPLWWQKWSTRTPAQYYTHALPNSSLSRLLYDACNRPEGKCLLTFSITTSVIRFSFLFFA